MTSKFIPVCEPMLDGNELKYVTDAVLTGWISSSGKYVEEFEKKFASYCGCTYGVAVCNGTIALHLALLAIGIEKGDEVIIPSFTMIASAFAVCYTGAKPIFVDAEKDSWNIDVSKIEEKITNHTKAIMPVHIFGKVCNMNVIADIAKRNNLLVIEDAAEAHGAEYEGRKAGSISDVAAFSFFANKNITTGEGGMVVTNRKEVYDRARYLKNVCFPLDGPRNYQHQDIGYNYRMSNLVAAVGLAQVERAEYYKQLRINHNKLYRSILSHVPGITFQSLPLNDCIDVCWMNAIIISPDQFGHTKNDLIMRLKQHNVDTRLLFTGMHHQIALQKYGCNCDGVYPVCDWLTENGLYLPSSSSLRESDIELICNIIKSFNTCQK